LAREGDSARRGASRPGIATSGKKKKKTRARLFKGGRRKEHRGGVGQKSKRRTSTPENPAWLLCKVRQDHRGYGDQKNPANPICEHKGRKGARQKKGNGRSISFYFVQKMSKISGHGPTKRGTTYTGKKKKKNGRPITGGEISQNRRGRKRKKRPSDRVESERGRGCRYPGDRVSGLQGGSRSVEKNHARRRQRKRGEGGRNHLGGREIRVRGRKEGRRRREPKGKTKTSG